ncbi:hypothetical protein Y11_13981 [Yersinia enterocolitica subsp. palearctica Y11]|uniref:Uncharacterized protein n=1 Tax=Yersinia enterocolitica subsp. palearctica serotype O:3 (strain DSM 13030 / CIP 106945 / Y11) TaxID=930944 RepID=A0A0H3NP20_YERE1|nr:hypothetical protein Y11_13981 [Yersinia enterocolitica subsp. palearctica Y11]CCO67717.1 hypothetical protein D322_821 [Yersinia enterocolitica IP 10393]
MFFIESTSKIKQNDYVITFNDSAPGKVFLSRAFYYPLYSPALFLTCIYNKISDY